MVPPPTERALEDEESEYSDDDERLLLEQEQQNRASKVSEYHKFDEEVRAAAKNVMSKEEGNRRVDALGERLDGLYSRIVVHSHDPVLGNKDAESLANYARFTQHHHDALVSGGAALDPVMLADQIKHDLFNKHNNDPKKFYLEAGRLVMRIDSVVPAVDTLNHLFEVERLAIERTVQARETIDAVSATNLAAEDLETDKDSQEIMRIYRALERQYRRNGGPIPVLQLALNNTSFAQTIENLFFASFLIKDHKAHLVKEDSDEVKIAPGQRRTSAQEKTGGTTHNQVVADLTYEDWQILCEIYEPIVESRRDADKYPPVPSTQTGSSQN